MSEEKLYELKQDICTPAYYIRAGTRKTEKEWLDKLGHFNMKWESNWFIDLEKYKDSRPIDELRELIETVFTKKGLNSISYKDAAREVAELWLKQNQYVKTKKEQSPQMNQEIKRWESTEAFEVTCKVITAITEAKKELGKPNIHLCTLEDINTFQDLLIEQGYAIQKIK